MNISFNEHIINLFSSLSALLISIIALVYTIRAFLLKSGQKIRCDVSTCSSMECHDNYIASITLENIKDKSSVIFKIYMKYGRNNYLLIEDFSDSPLILRPFEVYHKEYDPILFYSCGTRTIKLDKVFDNKKVKKSIVLSTTNGMYKVKTNTKRWDPIISFFKNYYTALIDHQRLPYKGKGYGSRVKFLLILKFKSDSEKVIELHDGDDKLKLFVKFQLTQKSLRSKEELELFIKEQHKIGNLNFEEIEIIDFQKHVNEIKSRYETEPISVESYGFFRYNILGRILTIMENRKMKKKNQKQNKKVKKTKGK